MIKIDLGNGKFTIIDQADFQALSKFKWRAVKAKSNWYAKATIYKPGGNIEICMHRFLMRTPRALVVHHVNHNSLDNRRSNLRNMRKSDHALYHRSNNLLVIHA